jgi:hypothetical protein
VRLSKKEMVKLKHKNEKERVKKKIERCLRIKKREWSHERELAERKGKEKMSIYAKESEVKRAFLAD